MMAKTGMLVVSNPSRILRILPSIQSEIKNILYIQYFPEKKWSNIFHDSCKNNDNFKPISLPKYSSTVLSLYTKTVSYQHLDIRVLLSGIRESNASTIPTKETVEIVYFDKLLNNDQMRQFVSSCLQNKTSDCQVISLPEGHDSSEIPSPNITNNTLTQNNYIFNYVVIGGTFDRLHSGHKVMLSEAILRCKKKITVGVTDTPMLKSKKLWELIQPCDLRIQIVRDFLEDVEPNLEYDIVPISDMYGPTKDDPTFEMIVVSSETLGGGSKINEVRKANGLNPLCVHSVDLLADEKLEEEEEDKISSSNLRLRCLGTLLRPSQPRPNLPAKPYLVGLTGGIASGKSSITNFLKSLGAGIVNCDQIAHGLYEVGTHGHDLIVQTFGKEILDDVGAIDRKKLGNIVFNDKEKLNKLNNLLWPLILEKSLQNASELHKVGHEIVFLEAAVLLQAGWQDSVHEVWVSIVPPKEAVKRLSDRNGLSSEEAQKRLDAQPSNSDQVKHANVVFCTLWRYAFTQKQVKRAWEGLLQRLGSQYHHH